MIKIASNLQSVVFSLHFTGKMPNKEEMKMSETNATTKIVNGYEVACVGEWASIALPEGSKILSAEFQRYSTRFKSAKATIYVESDANQKNSRKFDVIMVETGSEFEAKKNMTFVNSFWAHAGEEVGDIPVCCMYHVFYCQTDCVLP